ncbi:MAG: hypothetical protein O6848_10605 [Bacteroidetes bacterium]|nr:hypothetical protein [Bacteroidota bacterium]
MKRILFLLIFLTAFRVQAQDEFAKIPLPHKSVDKFYQVADNDGNICYLMYRKSQLYFYFINSYGELVKEVKVPHKGLPEITNTHFTDKSFMFFYQPRSVKKEGHIAALIIDKTTGEFTKHTQYKLLGPKEEMITSFGQNGHFYIMTAQRKTGIIWLTKFVNETTIEKKQFTYKLPLTYDLLSQAQTFLPVDRMIRKSIFLFSSGQKLYVNGNYIYFTFDDPRYLKTFIWAINWEQGTSEIISIPEKNIGIGTSSNSILNGNKLFRLTLDKDHMDLSVYNLHNGELADNFDYAGSERIKIKKGPIYSIYELERRFGQESEADMTRIYKIFSKGMASIYVDDEFNGIIKLTMGSYNPTSSGLSIGGAFGSFGSNVGISIGGSKQLTGVKQGSYFFNSYLTFPDLEIYSEGRTTATERINLYENKLNLQPSSTFYYREYYYIDKVHYAYVDRKDRSVKIIQFAR